MTLAPRDRHVVFVGPPSGISRFVVLLAGCATTVTLSLVATPPVGVLTVVALAAAFVPGLLLVRTATGPEPGWLPAFAFGPFLGYGLSSLTLLGVWLTGARGLWTVFAAPAALLPLLLIAPRARSRWNLGARARGDWTALALLVLLALAMVAPALANVGRETPAGRAYRAYFTADYVWRRAVVAELAKGDVLPANPFMRGDTLHYYWLPHLEPAVLYRSGGHDLDAILLAHSVVIDVAFVAFLYGLTRLFVGAPWAAGLGVATAVTATSYEGLYALWAFWQEGAPLWLVRQLNIDAVARWWFGGMPIDGLQRVLFYQPHHAIGYGLGFMGVLAVTRRRSRFDPAAFAVAGVLLGLSTLVSSFAGLMLTCVAALYEACSVLRWREWWRASAHIAAALLPLVLAAALVTSLEYVDVGGQIIQFGLNRLAVHAPLVTLGLGAGPILLVSLLAAWALTRARHGPALMFAALWVTCVGFYLFVDIRDHQDVYVGWRVGHLWFIASAALTAAVYQRLAGWRGVPRAVACGAVLLIVAAALPTTLIDVYNTQDIYNWAQGPGFTWTLLLSGDELDAFAWIKTHTATDAVFQLDALERQAQGWAYLPAFAERRLGVGLPISMVPLGKYEAGVRAADRLFTTMDPGEAHAMARRNDIQYLFFGSVEQERHPASLPLLRSAAEYFEVVFENRAATILRVR